MELDWIPYSISKKSILLFCFILFYLVFVFHKLQQQIVQLLQCGYYSGEKGCKDPIYKVDQMKLDCIW